MKGPLTYSLIFSLTAGALLISGCRPALTSSPNNTTDIDAFVNESSVPSDVELQALLDETLQWTLDHRELTVKGHAAWQILHGALAYQRDFLVVTEAGQNVSAVDYLINDGYMRGWTMQPGVWLDEAQTRRGLKAILEPGSKAGQGHADQWFAVLAQSHLAPEQIVKVHGRDFTMADYVAQIQYDIPFNGQQEYSWTLIGLTTYLPTDATWQAGDGKQWSIERLVEIEANHELAASACGGTHRLIGMSMALNRHLAAGHELTGSWKTADEIISQAILNARKYQNDDGSFSTNYVERTGRSADLATNLGATGHVLEFLTLAMTDDELEQPWVKRSVTHLCSLFQKTKKLPLECGALYHAAHGLAVYRSRVYGEHRYVHESIQQSDSTGVDDSEQLPELPSE